MAGWVPKHRFHVPYLASGAAVTFSPAQARQIATVLRMRSGDRVYAFDGRQPVDVVVELTQVSAREVSGRGVGQSEQPREPRVAVTVYPALLQRDKFEHVLQKVVEIGAARIVPTLAARSVVRELPDAARSARWSTIVQEAAEQGGRGVIPELAPGMTFQAAIEDAANRGAMLLAYEDERSVGLSTALAEIRRAPVDRLGLFVGPEGGLEAGEVELARSRGARVVSLGPRVLRTETASPVFTALVLYGLGEMEP